MPLFRKRPIVVKAEQWQEFNAKAREIGVCDCDPVNWYNTKYSFLHVHTLEGYVPTQPGDWIVTGTAGEKWPVKDYIFKKTYERVTGRSLRRME